MHFRRAFASPHFQRIHLTATISLSSSLRLSATAQDTTLMLTSLSARLHRCSITRAQILFDGSRYSYEYMTFHPESISVRHRALLGSTSRGRHDPETGASEIPLAASSYSARPTSSAETLCVDVNQSIMYPWRARVAPKACPGF